MNKNYIVEIRLDNDLTNLNLENDKALLLHSNTLGRNIGKIKVLNKRTKIEAKSRK